MLNVSAETKRIRGLVKPHYKGCLPITVYQDYASNTHDRIMLVFMNPSNKSDEDGLDESTEQARDGFRYWLTENANFYTRFLRTMQEYIPGKYRFKDRKFNLDSESSEQAVNEYMDYIKTDFFHDFYVTDYVKIRLSTSDMRRSLALKDNKLKLSNKALREEKKKVKTVWDRLLKEEVQLVSPKLVVSFGGDAWSSLKELTQPEKGEGPVTQVHGDTYMIAGEHDYIPLAFIPGTSSYLKDSYFQYLIDGLKTLFKIL